MPGGKEAIPHGPALRRSDYALHGSQASGYARVGGLVSILTQAGNRYPRARAVVTRRVIAQAHTPRPTLTVGASDALAPQPNGSVPGGCPVGALGADTIVPVHDPPIWSVALPQHAEEPFQVWVNGSPRVRDVDYTVEGRWLRFTTPLVPKVKSRSVGRRMMLLAGIGVYGDQKASVVDLQYHVAGHMQHATELLIIPPEVPNPDA